MPLNTRSMSSGSQTPSADKQSGKTTPLRFVDADDESVKSWKKKDWTVSDHLRSKSIQDHLDDAADLLLQIMLPLVHAKLLDEKFSGSDALVNYTKLVTGNEDVRDLLFDAVNKRDFTKIRRLEIFRKPVRSNTDKSLLPTYKNALTFAWNREYLGDCHTNLYNNINNMDTSGAYSGTVAILQSSGTGKSRMVDELAKLIFTIPMNIRNPNDENVMAYPPADKPLYELLRTKSLSDVDQISYVYYKFLYRLFETIYSSIANFAEVHSYQDLASAWRTFLMNPLNRDDTYRDRLYNDVCKTDTSTKGSAEERVDLGAMASKAGSSFAKLLLRLEELVKRKNIFPQLKRLVFYIDEAQELGDNISERSTDRRLDVLSKCFEHLRQSSTDEFKLNEKFMVIYLSTNSRMSVLAPPAAWASSSRMRQAAATLQTPITEVPFDCHRDLSSGIGLRTLKCADIQRLEFIAKFGRPLWWTLLEGVEPVVKNNFISTVQTKLLGPSDVIKDLSDRTAKLALLDCRLIFDYESSRESVRDVQENLISSHLRLAYSVHQSREYIRSGYSSEPVVAEVAAQVMNSYRDVTQDRHTNPTMLAAFKKAVEEGYLAHGDRGELIARYLLLQAFDNVFYRERKEESVKKEAARDVIYSRDCPLTTFMEELLAGDAAEQLMKSLPDNVEPEDRMPFREKFKNARVRFTHWVRTEDEGSVSTEALYAAFVRGMAFICWKNQPHVDLVIPILLCGENDDVLLEPSAMSAILIQVKNRTKASMIPLTAEEVQLFPKDDPSGRPYIYLLMDLGVQDTVPKAFHLSRKKGDGHRPLYSDATRIVEQKSQSIKIIPTYPGRPHTRSQDDKISHPRYNIHLPKCTSEVYRVVDKRQEASFNMMLGKDNFLHQHSYRSAASLSAVLNLKPFWITCQESFQWIKLGERWATRFFREADKAVDDRTESYDDQQADKGDGDGVERESADSAVQV